MPCNNFTPIIRTIEKSNDFFCLQKRRGHSERGERSSFTSKVVGTLDSIMDTKVCWCDFLIVGLNMLPTSPCHIGYCYRQPVQILAIVSSQHVVDC